MPAATPPQPLPSFKPSVSLPGAGEFFLKETIGDGTYGKVKRAVDPATQEAVAVKIIRKRVARDARSVAERKQLEKEIVIHRALRHENIIRLLGSDEDSAYVYIVQEYAAGGELFDKIAPDVGVEEDLAHFYFTQLVAGLRYCHSEGVAHRDLKPENILIDGCGNLKITDFGLSTVFRYNGHVRSLQTACGSPPYVAPEIHSQGYDGEAVDIWSAGVILYVLLVGNTPWDEPTKYSPEFRAYMARRNDLTFEPWNRIPTSVLDLICKILDVNVSTRYTMDQILYHEWFNRPNPLLTNGRCNDPLALAQRLMSNLFVSGEMDMIPSQGDPVSYTQPEFISSTTFHRVSDASHDMPIVSFSQPDAAMGTRGSNPQETIVRSLCTPESDMMDTNSQKERRFCDLCPSERLTRFYSRAEAEEILSRLHDTLETFLVPHEVHRNAFVIHFTTVDKRRCPLNGQVRIQQVAAEVQLVNFRKTKGDPLEFKRFFKAIAAELCDVVYTRN